MTFRNTLVLAVALLTGAGCDFQAAEDAFNDFDVIIELEPINTIIAGIVVDNSDGELVDAQLEFSGPGAGVLIDAYSDPITALDTDGGLVTFGIQNAVVPSEGSPVELTVTARAEGYYTTSESLVLTETGQGQFTIVMSSSNINARAQGTSSTQSSQASTGSNGQVTQTVVVETQATPQSTATAAVTVVQGSVPVTASGTPLTGQLTTQVRSYDSGAGLQALPRAARQRNDGTNQAVGGAMFFKMSDNAGHVAVGATAASSGVTSSKSAGVCEGGIQLTLRSSDAALRAAYDSAVTGGDAVTATAYAYTPADGQNNQVATIPVEADGAAGLKVDLCLGGTGASTGVVNTSAIGDANDGIIYTYSFSSAQVTSGPLAHQVTLGGFSESKNIVFTLAGPGINRTATQAVTPGTYTLAHLLGSSGNFDVVNQGTYVLTAKYTGSSSTLSTGIPSPLSGSSSLALPASSDLVTYNITASLQCDDPDTQKFEVQVTSESLDAISAFYRIAGSGDFWTLLPKSAQTAPAVATESRIELKGRLDLKPSTTYRFKGVLGNNSSSETQTTPATGGDWTISMSTGDVGINCVSK